MSWVRNYLCYFRILQYSSRVKYDNHTWNFSFLEWRLNQDVYSQKPCTKDYCWLLRNHANKNRPTSAYRVVMATPLLILPPCSLPADGWKSRRASPAASRAEHLHNHPWCIIIYQHKSTSPLPTRTTSVPGPPPQSSLMQHHLPAQINISPHYQTTSLPGPPLKSSLM